MAALQRAVAGGDHHHVAVFIGQALGLHVPGFVQVAFHETLAAPEGGDGLPGCGVEQLGDLLEAAGHLEPTTTTPEGGLDGHGQAVLFRETHHLRCVGNGIGGARHLRGTHLLRDVTGPDLVAQALNGLGGWADPFQARVRDGAGETGVLGQETVARVHGVGSGSARHVEEFLHA